MYEDYLILKTIPVGWRSICVTHISKREIFTSIYVKYSYTIKTMETINICMVMVIYAEYVMNVGILKKRQIQDL